MTFSESSYDGDNLASKGLPELKCELAEIGNERIALCETVQNQWPAIPPQAIRYLAENCPKPELMSLILTELRTLLSDNPEILSDPTTMHLLIDDCIFAANQKIADDVEDFEADILMADKSTNEVLTNINTKTANLKGRAKLVAAREYLSNLEITESIRSELIARFDQIEATLASMSSVFDDPASQSEFQTIVSNTLINFSAPNLMATFAPIIEQVEASETFTSEQKFKLRAIVTGTDAQNSLKHTVTNKSGEIVPLFTEENKREFRKGVSGYIEGHDRQMIEARAGNRMITKDVTGWSGEDVGLLIEATHMWNMYDSFGVTGFIEDVYKIDFSIVGDDSAFDPIQITHVRQVLSYLTGSFEGYDGDITNLSEHKTLIQNQSRLLAETQTAFGYENDRSGTNKVLRRIGMESEKGNPNMEVIKAFGNYTREHYGSGAPDQLRLVENLNRLHPALVKPLSDIEKATGKLGSVSEA